MSISTLSPTVTLSSSSLPATVTTTKTVTTTTSNQPVVHKKQSEVFEVVTCPECKESDVILDYSQGVQVCTSCGLCIGGQVIAEESEWRSFADDGKQSKNVNSSVCELSVFACVLLLVVAIFLDWLLFVLSLSFIRW